MKGPIYLVCISCTEEPYESLKGQLELLYGQVSCPLCAGTLEFVLISQLLLRGSLFSYINFCMQMILILTKSVNRCFEKNPKFDMTSLLGGTDAVFSSLIHSFSWYFFNLYHLFK